MKGQLTQEQIESLFAFTRKKYVRWYDVQVELVDHLASSIEEEMQKDKNLSFEKALDKVYARFGIFGFAKIVQEKEASMAKTVKKAWWKELIKQLNWPNVLRSFSIAAIIYLLIQFIHPIYISWGIFIVVDLIALYSSIKLRKNQQGQYSSLGVIERNSPSKKPLLMLQYAPVNFLFGAIYIPFLTSNRMFWDYTVSLTQNQKMVFGIFIWIALLIALAAFSLTENMIKKAKEQYPGAFA